MALGALRLGQGDFQLQSDLLALLPNNDSSQVVQLASKQLESNFGDEVLLLVAGENQEDVLAATQQVTSLVVKEPHLLLRQTQDLLEQQLRYFNEIQPHRFFLLSSTQREALTRTDNSELLQTALRRVFDLSGLGASGGIVQDPLGLFAEFIQSGTGGVPNIVSARDVVLLRSGRYIYGLVRAQVVPGAFDLDAQAAIAALDAQLFQTLSADLRLHRAGAVFHSAQAAAQAKREIGVIGVGSSLGICLLFLFHFRSLLPLAGSLGAIGYGCLCAFILSWNLFGSIHLLTLVFGASLIGVAVDYALHYLLRDSRNAVSRGTQQAKPSSRWSALPGLGLALVTSMVGYGSLLQARLPGLQAMAIFSILGLLATALFVLTVFPALPNYAHPKNYTSVLSRVATLPSKLLNKWLFWGLPLAISAIAIASASLWKFEYNIRVFHTPDSALLEDQQQVQNLFPSFAANQFLLLRGATPEALLQHAEQLRSKLDSLIEGKVISDYSLLSDVLPSLARQRANYEQLLTTVYREGGEADQLFQQLGLTQSLGRQFLEDLQNAQPLLPEIWLQAAPPQQRMLWLGQQEGAYYSIVLLKGVTDLAALQATANSHANTTFVDTVALVSQGLRTRTLAAMQMLLFAYAGIALLLLLRYRRWNALRLLLVPALSSGLVLALLSLAGLPITLFHLFALYLVLGLGMDYGIFLRESGPQPANCLTAILLSVFTSALSFGLLSISSTPMISAFGLTVMLGSLGNWLLVPLAREQADSLH